jgi:hypothetical protein
MLLKEEALSLVCAFYSPKTGILSAMGMFHQLSRDGSFILIPRS